MLPLIGTPFGDVPVGSVLSTQYPLIPMYFSIFSTIKKADYALPTSQPHLPFPFHILQSNMDKYLEHLSGETKEYVTKLKINMGMVDTVEKATINQAASSIWFHHRKGRLTDSMNNQLKMKNPKTEKGLLSAAQHLVNGLSTKNKVLQLKLSHGNKAHH